MIRTLEPFSRGWYAAPVGWIGADQAEFAVAIRSALVDAKGTISVYSGAGLVKDSDPEQEWVETELKKQLILNAVKSLIS
jgi:menaquinone-specific isochorismate synthase